MISEKTISAAKAGDILRDAQIPGLHLKINSKNKSWMLCYRVRSTGYQRRPKIGSYPMLSLKEARDIAREILVKVSRGEDPGAKSNVITLADLYAEFIKLYSGKLKPATLRQYGSLWNGHISEKLGRKSVRDIERHQVVSLHRTMGSAMGNRALALISRLYTFAEQSGYCDSGFNPARGIERNRESARRRIATRDELRRIGSGISLYGNSVHRKQRQFADILTLVILTGARISEWVNVKSEWIDLENAILKLPDSKTGEKSISIPSSAMPVILRNLGDTYLFQEEFDHKPFVNYRWQWDQFKKDYDLSDLRIHDLRRSFATYNLSNGMDIKGISKLLGHSNITVTDKVYAFHTKDVLAEKANEAADVMSSLVQLEQTSQSKLPQHSQSKH